MRGSRRSRSARGRISRARLRMTAAGRTGVLLHTHPPVLAGQPAEARPRERLAQLPDGDVAASVALAGKRKDRVRADVDAAADPAGEVHSQEGVVGAGDGVDQSSNRKTPFGGPGEVLPAERDRWRVPRRRPPSGPPRRTAVRRRSPAGRRPAAPGRREPRRRRPAG